MACTTVFDRTKVPQSYEDAGIATAGELLWKSREQILFDGKCRTILGRQVRNPNTGNVETHACNCDGTIVVGEPTRDMFAPTYEDRGNVVMQQKRGVVPFVTCSNIRVPQFLTIHFPASMESAFGPIRLVNVSGPVGGSFALNPATYEFYQCDVTSGQNAIRYRVTPGFLCGATMQLFFAQPPNFGVRVSGGWSVIGPHRIGGWPTSTGIVVEFSASLPIETFGDEFEGLELPVQTSGFTSSNTNSPLPIVGSAFISSGEGPASDGGTNPVCFRNHYSSLEGQIPDGGATFTFL